MKYFFIIIPFIFPSFSFADWPGQCKALFFYKSASETSLGNDWARESLTVDRDSGVISVGSTVQVPSGIKYSNYTITIAYFENGVWNTKTGSSIYRQWIKDDVVTSAIGTNYITATSDSHTSTNMLTWLDGCPVPTCSDKKDTPAGYNLEVYDEGSSPNLSNQCVDGCQVTAEKGEDLGPCVNQSCAASVIYTFTGSECGSEEDLAGLDDAPPGLCFDQWRSLVNKCGSSSNIGSFDWGSCSGECSKVDCSSEWSKLADRCGGEYFIVNWDGSKCTGTCKTDATPEVTNGDAPPKGVLTTKTTNADGSTSVKTITTYIVDGTEYTTTNTTNYDSDGNVTGTSSSGSVGPTGTSQDTAVEPSVDVPETWYTQSYDISNGLSSVVNYQQFFEATSGFQETVIFQLPNLLLQCLGYVEGQGCEHPPKIDVDLFGSWSSGPVRLDMASFSQVVLIVKFFFAIICIVSTTKLVMNLFK